MWTSRALQAFEVGDAAVEATGVAAVLWREKPGCSAWVSCRRLHYSQVTGKRNGKEAQERTQLQQPITRIGRLTSEVSEASLSVSHSPPQCRMAPGLVRM